MSPLLVAAREATSNGEPRCERYPVTGPGTAQPDRTAGTGAGCGDPVLADTARSAGGEPVAAGDRAVEVRRIYDDAAPGGAARILVDRLWPRGVSKDGADLDDWCTEVAPSDELRRWYAHDPSRFAEFRRRYVEELRAEDARDHLREIADRAADGGVVLLTATKDVEHGHATVLAKVIRGMM
jgi:uncharacterized protein YeaO (DUF488 family)